MKNNPILRSKKTKKYTTTTTAAASAALTECNVIDKRGIIIIIYEVIQQIL